MKLAHHILIKLFYYTTVTTSEESLGEHSLVQVHAYCVVVLYVLVEQAFHQSMRPERLLYFTLYNHQCTLRPSLVRSSIGLKYLTSLGLKNMKRIVDRLLFILKG